MYILIAPSATGQILLLLFMPLSLKVKKDKVEQEKKKKKFVFTLLTALCVVLPFNPDVQGVPE